MFSPLHPFDDGRKDLLPQLFLVPDKIIVNKEDLAPETIGVHALKFPDDLFSPFCTRRATAKQGNVAKLTVEGTAPGILDIDRGIVLHIDEFPQRNGCLTYVCPLIGGIDMAGNAIAEIFEESGQSDLSLVQHQMVHIPVCLIFGREKRTAGHDPDTGLLASCNHFLHRFLLDGHRAYQDQISPPEGIIMQTFHVQVDQSLFPRLRKHRCNGQQAEGWTARLSVNEFQGVSETPEGIREFRINEECIHGIPLILLFFLFQLQEARNGFNTLKFLDLFY